jgi:spore germination protein
MAANNITNPNILIVGQQLIIPAPGTTPPTTGEQVHTVQAGENLFRIGLNYGCTVDQLVQYNGLPSADAIIYVGDQILIPPDC